MAAPDSKQRIQTPWRTQWRRFCSRFLPMVAFTVCVFVVGRMWINQGSMPNGVGRVDADRVSVTVAADGKLIRLTDQQQQVPWARFDTVEQGQVVARLDDRPLAAELEALRNDAAALRAELSSTAVQATLDRLDREREHLREAGELAYQAERYRLEALEQFALVEQSRLELQQMQAQIELLETAAASGVGMRGDLSTAKANRDSLDRLLQARTVALRQAEDNLQAAEGRLASFPDVPSTDLDSLMAPLQDSIRAAEARIEGVAARIDSMVIRSPIKGTIADVHAHPGQGVRAGDPILTIAGDIADSITGYVPAAYRFRPAEGMKVGVRLRMPGSRMVQSVVQQVGSQWEPMPPELLRDPQMTQLALPVQIRIPQGLNVRPGEIVDIRFYRDSSSELLGQTIGALRTHR